MSYALACVSFYRRHLVDHLAGIEPALKTVYA